MRRLPMKRLFKLARIVAVVSMIVGFSVAPTTGFGEDDTVARPITDFLSTQGTYCIPDNDGCLLFVPPVPNYIAWSDPKAHRGASIDYAGLANQYLVSRVYPSLGTTFEGTITERRLDANRAEVSVLLRTHNALTFVIQGPESNAFDFANDPLLFGYRAGDLLALPPEGQPVPVAALGDSLLQTTFIITDTTTTLSAPLPDLIQIAFFPEGVQQMAKLSFRAQATGPLRSEFGVADGTPGRATVTQSGLFMTGGGGATADAFPAEKIVLQAVGANP